MKVLREFDSSEDAGLVVSILNWYCIPFEIGIHDRFVQVSVPESDYPVAVEMLPAELNLARS